MSASPSLTCESLLRAFSADYLHRMVASAEPEVDFAHRVKPSIRVKTPTGTTFLFSLSEIVK